MTETASIVAVIILFGLSVFQVSLIAGAPYGRLAWGGAHTVLPKKLRISSTLSVLLYVLFAITILSKAALISVGDPQLVDIAMWVFAAYFAIGILMNSLSRSQSEKMLMTPMAIVLAACFLYVAAS